MGSAGALPVPVGPEPQALSVERERMARIWHEELGRLSDRTAVARRESLGDLLGEIDRLRAERAAIGNEVARFGIYGAGLPAAKALVKRADELVTENGTLRARVAELEAERAKYVGREPTIAEEMAYLSRCIDSVLDLCDAAEAKGITSGGPFTVEAVRNAADGLLERRSYPPALPWAALMDDDDRAMFLDELADSATTHASSDEVLKAVEETCATWRLIAEAQHGHNTAPGSDAVGPDAPEMRSLREALTGSPDRLTSTFVPVASLREPEGEHYEHVHHSYRVPHDLPETGGDGRG